MAGYFITGGCGFFGTWIIRRLLDDGERVVVFDVQRQTRRWEMILSAEEIERLEFRAGRIDETEAFVATVLDAAPDAIIHLAGLQVPACRENPVLGARVNVIGTLNVFEAMKALANRTAGDPPVVRAEDRRDAGGTVLHTPPRLVYASSAAVFGPEADYAAETAVTDASWPKPTSHYGAYKLCNENCAKAYWIANKIASVGLRPLTVFGPGRDIGMTSFPTRAIAAAIKKQKFDIPFTGATAYIHAREVADMFVQCARAPAPIGSGARVYTVGGDIVDTAGFLRALEEVLPGARECITMSGGDLPIAAKVDDSILRADYPGLLRLPLKQGIAETVEVFRELEAAGKLEV